MRIGFYGVLLSVCVAANIPSELMAEDSMAEEAALAASASVTHYCVRRNIRRIQNDGNIRRQSVIVVPRSSTANENPCRRREVNITREVNLNLLDLRLNQEILSRELLVLVSNMDGSGAIGPRGPAGPQGEPGAAGNDGAPGTNGRDGQSAYEVWLAAGNDGSQEEFLTALRGEVGPQGSDGADGVNGAPGNPGRDGEDGRHGAPGRDGNNGKSAYELWRDQGNTGDQQAFLNALRGPPGTNGTNGTNGERGPAGRDGVVSSVAYPSKVTFPDLPSAGRAYLNNSTKVQSVTVSANMWCTNVPIGLQAVVRQAGTNFPFEQTRQWDYSHPTGFHSSRVHFSVLVNPQHMVELTRWGMTQPHDCWSNISNVEFVVTDLQ